jgi:hypothetical protein
MRPVATTVDDALETKIAEAVAARRELLAELVRQAVDRQLVELVDSELDAALERLARNGRPAREPCADCGERPRLPSGTVCNRCRTARRARAMGPASPGDDGPRADTAA